MVRTLNLFLKTLPITDETEPSTNKTKPICQSMEGEKETVMCTIVALDHSNGFCYRVCSICERPLHDNDSSCMFCDHNKAFNNHPRSSGSKHLFRVLMSIATDTKVFVVVCFDRVVKALFGGSADEFFDFAKLHPFAAASAGEILEGEMFQMTLSKPKNGNAQHMRVVSVVPLRSSFRPAIETLRELYEVPQGDVKYMKCVGYVEDFGVGLESSAFYDVKAHLTWVRGLQLHLNSIKLSFEPVLGACIYHLVPYLGCIRSPMCKEFNWLHQVPENSLSALRAVLVGGEIKVKDCIAALISRQRRGEIIIACLRGSNLVDDHLLAFNLEGDEAVDSLCF
ncbi:hypothetical protein AKJ16_DCAP16598 [Drosera capensis]